MSKVRTTMEAASEGDQGTRGKQPRLAQAPGRGLRLGRGNPDYGIDRCVQMFWNSTPATGLSEPAKLRVPAAKTRAPAAVS